MPLTSPATPSPDFQEAYLSYVDPSGATNTIVFDSVTAETWSAPTSVTEHPVEKGANVADHVRVQLVTCSLTIRVSNEPLGPNQFTDPVGGGFSPLTLSVPGPTQDSHTEDGTEFTGIVMVPTWISNLALSEQIGIVANLVSGAAGNAAQTVADATPLGNAFAQGLKPLLRASQTGNEVLAYDIPQVEIGGVPIRSVGDAVSALVYEGITSLVPSGEEVDLPVPTSAGLPTTFGEPTTVTAQVVQFDGSSGSDFAAQMILLLTFLKNAAQQFTVYGSKQDLAPMVIEVLTSRRGAPEDTGTGVEITLGFKEVRLVSTSTADVPLPKIPRASPPVDNGQQDGPEAEPADMSSALLTLAKWFTGG